MIDISGQIETLRERIDESDDISDADRDLLHLFSDRLDLHAQTYSDYRVKKLLRHVVIMAENLDGGTLTESIEDREASERIVAWINRTYDNEETNSDYRSALRVFGTRVAERRDVPTNESGTPTSLSWVPTGTSNNYDPTPDPRNMLKWDDHVDPMIESCFNTRDKAMLALQFDAGLRGGEFKSLTVGDVQDHDHGLQVTVEGKQGRRTVLLIPSVPYVNQWLANHPDASDDKTPLWSKLTTTDGISDTMVGKVLKEAADRVGIDRPVTLTNLRKSSAAFLASRNLNQAHIEDHHGWVRGSKAAARYISVFGEDSDREIARVHGKDVSNEEPEPISFLDCPRCGRETPREKALCIYCGQAMDPQTAAEIETEEDEFTETLAELPPGDARTVMNAADILERREIKESRLDR